MATIKLVLRPHIGKDKKAALMIRVCMEDKVLYYPTNIRVRPEDYNPANHLVKKSEPMFDEYNRSLTKLKYKADNAILQLQEQSIPINPQTFERAFYNDMNLPLDFYTYAEKQIEKFEGRLSHEVIRQYNCELSKLKKFRPVLTIRDIDYEFIRDYEHYMINTLKNKTNTLGKTFKKIKSLLRPLTAENKITDPFSNYKIRTAKTNRAYLDEAEINKIRVLAFNPKESDRIRNIAKCFLFQTYTGLRYADLKSLTHKDIVKQCIQIETQKTGEKVFIPLSDSALALINPTDPLFNLCTNQKYNDYLKVIAEKTGIEKNLTSHVARHTFATLCLSWGIPLEVVSKLLGHTDLKMTMIMPRL